jgi:hypothetical protein
MRWAGNVARMDDSRGAYRILVGRFDEKIPLAKLSRRWKNNIKGDLKEVGWGHGFDWSGS